MSTIADKRLFTPADLLARPDAVQFELVNGELVERNVSVLSSMVEAIVVGCMYACAKSSSEGIVWTGTIGCRFYADAPDKIRKPDAVFVRRERFSPEHYQDGFLTIRPDIVVEVISANDLANEVNEKTEEYLDVGVPLVWVVDPEARIVQIHRLDGTVTKLHVTDELTGEDVFPSFRCPVSELSPSTLG